MCIPLVRSPTSQIVRNRFGRLRGTPFETFVQLNGFERAWRMSITHLACRCWFRIEEVHFVQIQFLQLGFDFYSNARQWKKPISVEQSKVEQLPERICLDVITPLALTVRMECNSGTARRFELIRAVMQPILLRAIQTQGYSMELSITKAITSPWT